MQRQRTIRLAAIALAGTAAVAIVALYLTALGDGFGNSDEVIYAELIRAMHRSGDWLTVTWQGVPVLQRPAAPIALYAAVAAVVPGELGLRLLPSLLTAAGALVAGAIVWRRFASLGAGVATALLVAATPSVLVYGRMLLSDPPFVLACLGALAATMAAQERARWVVGGAAGLGAAFAMKSLAAAFPAVALAPWLFVAWRRHGRAARPALAVVAFLALATPFYAIGLAQHGGEFVRQHFGYNLLGRAAGSLEGVGIGGPAAYLEHLWRADGWPFALVLLGGVVAAAVLAWRRRDRQLGVAASYAIVVLAGLSLVGTRLPHYLLVFYPAAALCAGAVLARLVASPVARAGAAGLAALVLVLSSGRPAFIESSSPSAEAILFGPIASRATPPGAPVYTLDWYAPALGYYADRDWKLLATQARLARIVGGIDIFAAAGTVQRVPPWPTPPFVVAGARAQLDAVAPGARVLATLGDRELRLVK